MQQRANRPSKDGINFLVVVLIAFVVVILEIVVIEVVVAVSFNLVESLVNSC